MERLLKEPTPSTNQILDFIPAKIHSISEPLSGSKKSISEVLNHPQMSKFLKLIGCSQKEAEQILSLHASQIFSNEDFILNKKGLDVSKEVNGKEVIPLACCMAAILERKMKLGVFLNIRQQDILVICRLESSFNPSAQSGGDCGLFQINAETIRDLLAFSQEIKKTMATAGATQYSLQDLGINENNYAAKLKDLSTSMAVFPLVIYRKLQIALADSRSVGPSKKFTNSSKSGGGKKHNLLFGREDPLKSRAKNPYHLDEWQKRYFFSDYYNANGRLSERQIDYGLNLISHSKEITEYGGANFAQIAPAGKKSKDVSVVQSPAAKSAVQAPKPREASIGPQFDLTKNRLEQFSSLIRRKYSQSENAANFWAQNFTNKQEGLNEKHSSKLYSVMDVLNLSIGEMEAIIKSVWDISTNRQSYSFDSNWNLYESALSFDASHYGSNGNKRSLVRWFVRSLQTALNGGTEIPGGKGDVFRMTLKAAKSNFKVLPDGGEELFEKIRKINKALSDSKNKLS